MQARGRERAPLPEAKGTAGWRSPVLPHLDFGLAFSELWQKGLVLFLITQACSATQWGVLGRQACSGHEATAQLPGHRVQNGAVVVGTPPAIHARPAIRAVSTCGAAWEEGCGLRGRRAPQYRAGGAPERAPSCVQEDRRGQGWTEVTAPMDLTGARPCLVRHEGGCPAEAPSGQPDSRVSPHFPTHTPLCEPPSAPHVAPPARPCQSPLL